MKLLLHACCGPCTLEPSRILREEGADISVFYANSNIHPEQEYLHRLSTLRAWAAENDLPVIEAPYDPALWEETAGKAGQAVLDGIAPREARCRACYRLRFEEAAAYAAERGYDAIGTTLSVSPYQYTDIIREELARAAEKAGVACVFRDFRPFYYEATKRSRALGMYRQNFCGCRFSDDEAALEREQRAQKRARERAEREAARAGLREQEERLRAQKRAEKAAYNEKQRRKHAILKEMRKQARAAEASLGASADDAHV